MKVRRPEDIARVGSNTGGRRYLSLGRLGVIIAFAGVIALVGPRITVSLLNLLLTPWALVFLAIIVVALCAPHLVCGVFAGFRTVSNVFMNFLKRR